MNWMNVITGFLVGETIGSYFEEDPTKIDFADGVLGAWIGQTLSDTNNNNNEKNVVSLENNSNLKKFLSEFVPNGIIAKIKILKDVNSKYQEGLEPKKLKVIDDKNFQEFLLLTTVFQIVEKYKLEGIKNIDTVFKSFIDDHKEIFEKNNLDTNSFLTNVSKIIKEKAPNLLINEGQNIS